MTTGLTRPTRLTRLDNSMDSCSNKVSHVPLVARGLMKPAQGLSSRGTGCNSSVERHAAKAQLQRRGRPAMRGCVCLFLVWSACFSCLFGCFHSALPRSLPCKSAPSNFVVHGLSSDRDSATRRMSYPCGWYSAQSLKHLSWCVWDVFGWRRNLL